MVKAALHELRADLTDGVSALMVEIHELLRTEIGIIEIMPLDEARDGVVDLFCRKALAFQFLAQLLFAVRLPCEIVDRRRKGGFLLGSARWFW